MTSGKPEDADTQFAAMRLAAIVESSDDAIIAKDLNGVITSWNRGAERLFGYTADEVIGRPVIILIPEDRHNEELGILARIRRGERVEHYETVRKRKDGSPIDISLSVSPIRDLAGRIVGASKIARDISRQKAAEEQQRLLIGELHHRIKNLFTLAASIVSLTARSAETPSEMAERALARIRALDRAHRLTLPPLPDADKGAAEKPASLLSLIETIVAPYNEPETGKSRITATGADIDLAAKEVTALALTLNEFATNATKHGALSVPDGRIEIVCTQGDDRYEIVWTESGGPPTGQDGTVGFGTTLVQGAIGGQMGGTISYDWQPDRLAICISLPLDRMAARTSWQRPFAEPRAEPPAH